MVRGRNVIDKKHKNVLLGEKDESGAYKVPHTVYGLISNLGYIFQKVWKYKRVLFLMFVIGAITQSVMRYLYSYIGKYLVDIVETQMGVAEKSLTPLVQLLAVVVLIEIFSIGGNTIITNRLNIRMSFVRYCMVTEKNDKLLSMNYQMLEQPHILDLHQRATNAVGGDWQGVGGVMYRIYYLLAQLVTMVVTATSIIVLDPRLIFVLTLAMLINYASQRWSIRSDKKNFWDATSSLRRKMSYMERTTQDFDFAKDIRLFSLKPWLLTKQRDLFGLPVEV